MPRKTGQPTITIQLSEAQRLALYRLHGDEPINQYVRRLIAEDAARRDLDWPDDIGEWTLRPRRKGGSKV